MNPRQGQIEFERGVFLHRVCGLLARRQYGKTTRAARIAMRKMMLVPGHTVVFGSVKLDLGREMTRKEADAIGKAIRDLVAESKQPGALRLVETSNGRDALPLSADDFADLYEHSRLEFRFYHSSTTYSRTKVVALTPEAVGETGDLIMDEVGRVRNFDAVLEAVMPIIASNPAFRCIYTTTPPPDDGHPSFALLAPPIGADLPVNPRGNWYRSEMGVHVLRVTAEDAYADGIPLYDDDTGAAISPAESRARSHNKDAWDRNYGCQFVLGGTSACGLMQLDTAQRRGVGECALCQIETDGDLDRAAKWLAEKLGPGRVALGFDVATTTGGTSNPSALAVSEQCGPDVIVRAVLVWKTTDPAIAQERIETILRAVRSRPAGGSAARLAVDATGERYFAHALRQALRGVVPVDLVVASETVDVGGERMTRKQQMGGRLVAELEDNHLWLPPERYLREDFRLVKRDRGSYVCEPDTQGRHGDTFDAVKLSLDALLRRGDGRALAVQVGGWQGGMM